MNRNYPKQPQDLRAARFANLDRGVGVGVEMNHPSLFIETYDDSVLEHLVYSELVRLALAEGHHNVPPFVESVHSSPFIDEVVNVVFEDGNEYGNFDFR